MATIKEIAELAGVSRGTVDRVLNHRGSVSEKTAQKIMEIARALNYKPNRAGIALAAQKKHLKLGVVLCPSANPFFGEIIQSVDATATELSYYNCQVLMKQVTFDAAMQLKAIEQLLAEGIHGLAICPVNVSTIRDKINELIQNGIPVVTYNTDLLGTKRLAYVGSNFIHCGDTAAGLMRLMTDGPIEVGIITGSADVLCHTERVAGFTRTVTSECPRIHIVSTVYNEDDDIVSYEQTLQLLQKNPQINTLFFAAAGVYGGCRAVKALGLSKKLQIFSFDAVPTTRELIQDGTICATICQHPEIQGRRPLEILFDYLTRGELPEEEYLYTDVDIRIRENISNTPNTMYGG